MDLRALSISDIPLCGLSCLFLTVPLIGCALDDYDCQCRNVELAHTLSTCMLANCTMADTLNTAKVQQDICHLSNESKQKDVYIYTIACYTIAVSFVLLRVIGRIVTRRFALDDYIVITALLFTTVPLGLVLKMAGVGFGEHLWNLQEGQLLQNLRFFYVAWVTYTFVLGLTKISLALLYREVFPSPGAQLGSLVFLGWIAINTLILIFLTIFNCNPVNAFWDRDIKDAKCTNINAIAYANSASAIAQDVALLIFPLACIRTLNMTRWRKIMVGIMFAIGTLGCIATIVRLHTILAFKTTIDPTWDYVPITIWTEIELACCFACLSLPAIRMLLGCILPDSFFSSITSRYRSYGSSAPDRGVDIIKPNSIPAGRGFRSWKQVSSDHEQDAGKSSEMDVLSRAGTDARSEKSRGAESRIEEARISDVEDDILPTPWGHL
ncbi:hypothetical protein COCSADRAFT_89724 [Bipolaris sorokiniana ND90Pr]|nr:uncharacterized protein COCSADRAFT_89724 [Bipolaris sorokiniana ND90Pr]EMD64139.1 hypothetical protein COCSADRAFT_89724 [Bipolaris sorokiniana ND90Pr]